MPKKAKMHEVKMKKDPNAPMLIKAEDMPKQRRSFGFNPTSKAHSSKKGKRGYNRKDKSWAKGY